MSSLLRALTSLPARVLITCGLLGALAWLVDWRLVLDRLADGQWGLFVAAVALLSAGFVLSAVRWRIFLDAAEIHRRFALVLRAFFVGTFTNNFLPTGFGGDGVRALMIARPDHSFSLAFGSVLIDRASGLGCLLTLAWLVYPLAPSTVPSPLVATLGAITAGFAAFLLAAVYLLKRGRRLAYRVSGDWLRRAVANVAAATLKALGSWRVVARTTALGLVVQATTVGAVWLLARVIGLHLSVALVAVVVPIALVATLVPVSIAGLGVREGSFVILLAQADVDTSDATLLSLMMFVAAVFASLPGAVYLLAPHAGTRRSKSLATAGDPRPEAPVPGRQPLP